MERLKLTRRGFLKSAGAAGTLLLTGGGLAAFAPRLTELAGAAPPRGVPRLIPTVCGVCPAQCGVLAYVQDGRLLKLEGNWNHSHSQGRICARGGAAVRYLYDEDRLKSPLKRVGDGKYEKISWDQAFGEIGEKLSLLKAKSGPETLAMIHRPGLIDEWESQFMAAFGSPNIFSDAALGHYARTLACTKTLGDIPISDLRNTKYSLIFGRNFAESMFTSDATALADGKEHGAHVVVVDPRLTHTAAFAHEWVPIKPGTDGAFILAMMNVIVKEGLHDRAFLSKHANGFEDFQAFLEDKTPSWAASETQIDADTITRIAKEFAAAKPACGVDPGWHGGWGALYNNSVQTARAALALNALVGSYGAKGGLLMPNSPKLGQFSLPQTPAVSADRADGAGSPDYPFASSDEGMLQRLPDIVLSKSPYPVRALIVNRGNPARSLPNTTKALAALRQLDLLVVIDTQMSDTAQMAHYVLPESTFLEREDPLIVSQRFVPEVALRQPVVEPLYDTRPAYDILSGLAGALGLAQYLSFTVNDVNKAKLAATGRSLSELRASGVLKIGESAGYGEPVFTTGSGKIELVLQDFQQVGVNPMPSYEPPLTTAHGERFRLISGRDRVHNSTSTQNNSYLHALSKENTLWMNPIRAVALGVSDGDRVLVSSEVGEIAVRARVTEGIHPESVFLAHGYGVGSRIQRLAYNSGVNDNYLIPDRVEPLAGTAAIGETLVKVKRLA